MKPSFFHQDIIAIHAFKRNSTTWLCAFLLLNTLCFRPVYGQLELLADFNQAENTWHNEYSELTNAGYYMYFVSNNELWKSNGTTRYTAMLKAFDAISNLTMSGSTLYFTADDGNGGMELWKSNGSARTTIKVKEIVPGSDGASPMHLTDVNGTLYFSAWSPATGRELWKSDGTAAGTVLVEDIARGNANPENLVNNNGTLYFSAHTPAGIELWRSQGTPVSTSMVKDIYTGIKSGRPQWLTASNGKLFFTALHPASGRELWISDGTPSGTRIMKDIRPGTGSSVPENLTDVNGTLMFSADDGVHGDELWKSNGFFAGTVLVKDLNSGRAGSNNPDPLMGSMGHFTNINGVLFFLASKGADNFIYRSDGTAAGTVVIAPALGVTDLPPQPAFTYHNNYTYFFNSDGSDFYTYALYRMPYRGNIIQEVKKLVAPLPPPEEYSTIIPMDNEMIRFNNNVYFFGRVNTPYESPNGFEFIRSDGTNTGTVTVHDTFIPTDGTDLHEMITVNNIVYVLGYGAPTLSGLYRTDGTVEGTYSLLPIWYHHEYEAAGDALYIAIEVFEAGAGSHWELHRSEGTPETTYRVILGTGWSATTPEGLTAVDDVLYFHNFLGELWKTDGTAEGTLSVGDFGAVHSITDVNGQALVLLSNTAGALEAWKDTDTGFVQFKTFGEGVTATGVTAALEGIFYFIVNAGDTGYQLWRSDGTAEGTIPMFGQDKVGSSPALFAVQDILYVSSRDSEGTWHLSFVTDTDIVRLGTVPQVVTAVAHREKVIVFTLDENQPMQVYALDGLSAEPELLTTISYSNPYEMSNFFNYNIAGEYIYFKTMSEPKLWRSDGTVCGTTPVDLIAEDPYDFEVFGDDLIFGGTLLATGHELYAYRNITSLPGPPCGPEEATSASAGKDSAQTGTLSHYPNPFSERFTLRIDGKNEDIVQVSVYDENGRPVEKLPDLKANTEYAVGASWRKGSYIVKVFAANTVRTFHVMKE